jgi:tape measure domain-containing protein
MAQGAGIQLQVGLDLAYFRNQLPSLGTAAAGYRLPINIQFNRRSVQNELNALGRNISQRKYRLEVATNISAEIEGAKRLAKLLREMPTGSKGVAGVASKGLGQKAFLGIDPNEIKRLYRAAADAGLVSFNESIANNKRKIASELGSVGKDSVAGLLNGLNSQNAQLKKAAQSLGNDLLASVKGVLGIASPSREFRKIGDESGKGFEQGLIRSMEIAEKSATRQLQRMLDRLARMALMAGGMSAAEISRQAGAGIAQRMIPGPSWTATTPSRSSSIGPSSSGRLLAGAPAMRGLPGSVYGEQKRLVGDILSPSLKEVLRGAANAFADAVRTELNSAVRSVQVRDLGRTMRTALTPQRTAGLLSAGVGRAPSVYSTGGIGGESREQMIARRTREAYMRSAQREMDVMGGGAGRPPSPYSYANRAARPRSAMVPYSVGGALVPMGGGAGGTVPPRPPSGGGGGGMGGFGRSLGGINLPGTGIVREIGNEFAMATKQVLLFGTAYKALAFLTSFPSQVGQAVGALQSFNNTLKAISPTAEEAKASNQFILDIVDRYNVPLQSARDGFTKLYASMAPAGFKGDEIRELFTGVSQAAATFGMSADKVDRVNYAFAQMASKGQVMSEELKGQLGDVLPGAMGIFAEAAGMEGPDAIQKFSKALEDGAYKGEAMRVLLKNVSVVLTKEFGPGAEGAARTFQGVINRMQNSTKLLYEAFEPVAVGFLNSVVVPLTSGIKTVADGFNAFFKGVNAKTSGGFAIAQGLEKLKPVFEGIRTNLTSLLPAFQSFGQVVLQLSKVFLQIAGNPFAGYLARVYLSVLPLTIAVRALNLQALIPLIASFLRAIPAFIAFTVASARSATVLQAVRTAAAQTGQTALVTAGQVKLLSTTLKAAFASTVVLAIVAGIGMIIEKMISLGARMDEVRQKAMGAAESIRSMSQADARQAANQAASDVKLIQGISQRQQLPGQAGRIAVTPQEQAALERAGVSTQTTATRGRGVQGIKQTVGLSQLRGAIEARQGIRREAEYRQRVIKSQDEQVAAPIALAPIAETAKDSTTGAAKKLDTYNRSQLDFIKQRAEQEKLALDRRLQQQLISETQYKISLAELELETAKLEQAEKLRLVKEQINKDNLSAQDKQLKLADAQISYQNELNIAQDKYTVAVEGARKELEGPLNDAVKNINIAMNEQGMLLSNLKEGIGELTPDQEAYLQVQRLIGEKTEDELNILKEKIQILRGVIEQQILLNQEVEREKALRDIVREAEVAGAGFRAGYVGPSAAAYEKGLLMPGGGVDQAKKMAELQNAATMAKTTFQALEQSVLAVGDAFGTAMTMGVSSLVNGTASAKEVFASFLNSIGTALLQAAQQMIATYIAIGIARIFAGMGGGGLSNLSAPASISNPLGDLSGIGLPYATGGIAPGGFQAFANGGVVNGPTLGLVGEGKYNEAIVPLPNGRSIPVDLGGGIREKMSNSSPSSSSAPVLSMSFETTSINGVEYVSRDQLEQAMMETRKLASKEGAMRGANLAIDRLQQSPNIRRRVGMR